MSKILMLGPKLEQPILKQSIGMYMICPEDIVLNGETTELCYKSELLKTQSLLDEAVKYLKILNWKDHGRYCNPEQGGCSCGLEETREEASAFIKKYEGQKGE